MFYKLEVFTYLGIKVFYNIGEPVLHGSDEYRHKDRSEDGEFHLGPGERIVSVNARAGWMIDQLEFICSLESAITASGNSMRNS